LEHVARPPKADSGGVARDSVGWRLNDLMERAGLDGAQLSAALAKEEKVNLSEQAISNIRTNTTEMPRPATLAALASVFQRRDLAWADVHYLRSGKGGPADDADDPAVLYSDDFINQIAHRYNLLHAAGAPAEELQPMHDMLMNAWRARLQPALGNRPKELEAAVYATVEELLEPSRRQESPAARQRRPRKGRL
jgi:hypothetical protein